MYTDTMGNPDVLSPRSDVSSTNSASLSDLSELSANKLRSIINQTFTMLIK